MTDQDRRPAPQRQGGQNDEIGSADSVFDKAGGPASHAKSPADHPGASKPGEPENDVDRAEEAGREGGRR